MVLLNIQCEILGEEIDNFINKTVGAACAEIKFKFLSRKNHLRRLIGRSEP